MDLDAFAQQREIISLLHSATSATKLQWQTFSRKSVFCFLPNRMILLSDRMDPSGTYFDETIEVGIHMLMKHDEQDMSEKEMLLMKSWQIYTDLIYIPDYNSDHARAVKAQAAIGDWENDFFAEYLVIPAESIPLDLESETKLLRTFVTAREQARGGYNLRKKSIFDLQSVVDRIE